MTFGDFGFLNPDAFVPLNGLHVSEAGNFYWPGAGVGVHQYPPSAPPLTASQVRDRVTTGEIRPVK